MLRNHGLCVFVFALCLIADRIQAITLTWDGGGGDNNASTAANWTSDTAPLTGDDIVLDGTSTKAMTWDDASPSNLVSWSQLSGYSGTVTFETHFPGQGLPTNITITGNCTVNDGTWTHPANTGNTVEEDRLAVSIGGALTIGASGSIDVSSDGFAAQRGPGYGGASNGGSGYGGRGEGNHATILGLTYGSATAPTRLGSGGGTTRGGGLIRLGVTGAATINGTLAADGGDTGSWQYAGAGGSVFLTAASLTGSGSISADGGGGGNRGAGGGGRIAVILSGSDSFGSVSMHCHGGSSSVRAGAAGTVYKEGQSDGGRGELFMDANNLTPNNSGTLSILSDAGAATYDFARYTCTNAGAIAIDTNDTLTLTNATLTGDPSGPSDGIKIAGGTLNGGATLSFGDLFIAVTEAGSTFDATEQLTIASNGILVINRAHTLSSNVTVQAGGNITHDPNGTTDENIMDLTINGNLTIDAGGAVTVYSNGFSTGQGPGVGVNEGAGHGGRGGFGNGQPGGETYGSIVCPTNSGSGANHGRGGGAVKLTVLGTTTLNGEMNADGFGTAGGWQYQGSGGSVYLTTASLAGSGTITAKGGDGSNVGAGGGGRIAVTLTASSSFGSVDISANGGPASSITARGAAGTIYLRTQSQGLYEGTLVITNFQNSDRNTDIMPNVLDANVGNVLIGTQGRLNINTSQTLTVSGIFSNGNVFSAFPGASNVFSGAATSTVYGTSTFKNFVVTTPSKRVDFHDASTTDVDEGFFVAGADTSNVIFRSTTGASQWSLDVDAGAALSVDRVDVQDSDASAGATISATASTDSGNNINWSFVVVGETNTWLGTNSTAWSFGGNWDKGRAPIAADNKTIISNGTFDPVLPSVQILTELEIQSGAVLSLGGFNLTVENALNSSGTITAAGSELITVQGDVDFSGGGYNASASTVAVAGASAQAVTSDGVVFNQLTVSGSGRTVTFSDPVSATSFRNESVNLTFSGGVTATSFRAYTTAAEPTLTFGDGSSSCISNLFLIGTAANTNILVSANPGTQWNLDVKTCAHVINADVTDSDASGGITIYPITSRDGGNNANWNFGASWSVWNGGSTDFGTAGNWTPSGVPASGTRVLVDGNNGNAPIMSSSRSILSLSLGPDQTSDLTVSDVLTVGEDVKVLGFGTLTINDPATITNDLLVATGGRVTHSGNGATDPNKVDLTVNGSVTVDSGAEINVSSNGFSSGQGPGVGVNEGGGYGGRGGFGNGQPGGETYGSITCPTNSGSGGNSAAGGGAVKLTVLGTTTINGTIAADGRGTGGSWQYQGSGGSVYLTTASLAGSGTITAEGGDGSNVGAGGGGRVAVTLTASSSFGPVDISANGGSASGTTTRGAAGTIYLRTQSQGLYEGTLVITNFQNSDRNTDIMPNVLDANVGNVLIGTQGRLNINTSQTLTVSGVFSNGNVFSAFPGATNIFSGTTTSIVYGANTFGTLLSTTPNKRIEFQAGVTSAVDEAITFTGSSGNEIVLRSTSGGTQWGLNIDAGAAQDMTFVDVQDSDAQAGATASALSSTDSGNNDNWSFGSVGETNIWVGTNSTAWSSGLNWTLGRAPLSSDLLVVISNGTFDPILPVNQTLQELEIVTGADLNLAGFDLTLTKNATIAGTITATGTETLDLRGDTVNFTGGSFVSASSLLLLNSLSNQTVTSAAVSFNQLTTTNAGRTVTFSDNVRADMFRNAGSHLTYSGGITAQHFRAYTSGSVVTQTFGASSSSCISNMFVIGTSANTNVLRSSSPGTQWNLNVKRCAHVRYADVTDSDASGGITIYPITSRDGGNNANWNFGASWAVWNGSASGDFGTAGNWTPSGVPAAGTRVLVDGNYTYSPTVSVVRSVLELVVGADQTSYLTANTPIYVGDGIKSLGFGTISLNKTSYITNDVLVANGGLLTHTPITTVEIYKLDLSISGNLIVDSGGALNVSSNGFNSGQGPGTGGGGSARGAAHGGRGDGNSGNFGQTYGSCITPTNSGSGGGSGANGTKGGGCVRLTVQGSTTLNGDITADGQGTPNNWTYTGSGGSVLLTTASLGGSGSISAGGGEGSVNADAGGGGRIAVHLTGSDSFGSVVMSANGAGGSSANMRGAAGTIYLEGASQTSGAGLVIISNATPQPSDNETSTYLPAEILASPTELVNATIRITNGNTRVDVSTDITVGDLYVTTGTTLDLNSYTVTVNTCEHPIGGGTTNIPGVIVWICAEFAITAESAGGADNVLTISDAFSTRSYQILRGDGDGGVTRVVVFTTNNPSGSSFTYTDSGVMSDTSVTSRYYQVVEIDGGSSETNSTVWVLQKQPRGSNQWHMVGPPVHFGDTNQNRLSGTLGVQIGNGLVPQLTDVTAPNLWAWDNVAGSWSNFWFFTNRQWYTTAGDLSTFEINSDVGVWIKTQSTDPGSSNTVFTGQAHTNAPGIVLSSNTWILFSWPFASRQFETEGTVGNQGWQFSAQGGQVGTSWENSDRMFMEYNGAFYNLYLGPGGRWYIQNTSVLAPVALQHGKSYYYYSAGTAFTWTATSAN